LNTRSSENPSMVLPSTPGVVAPLLVWIFWYACIHRSGVSIKRNKPLIRFLDLETFGMVSTLRVTVAGSISTPSPVGELSPHKLLPFPWTAGLSRPSPAPYTLVHLSRGGKLLYP